MGRLRNKMKKNKRVIASVVAIALAAILLLSMAVPFMM